MRIAFLNPCGQMGGAETSLVELLASVRSAEPDWDLLLILGENGPLAQRARSAGVKVRIAEFPPSLARLGDSGGRPLTMVWSLAKAAASLARFRSQLQKLLAEIQPDLIHTNGFKMHLLSAWSAPPRIPVIWHIHDYVRSRRLMSRVLKRNSSRCSRVVVNSKSVAADVQRLLPDHPVSVVYNAVDFDRFAPVGERLDLDAVSGLPPADPSSVRIGLVGTFAKWKGHKVFLEALSYITRYPVRGYIIGGPIYQTAGSQWTMAELRAEVSRLGLDGRVGFTGPLDSPEAAMRSLDIVVHASTEPEPFGMVIVEAMGCARPVIVSNAGGAAELFEDGRTALGCPPGDPAVLAAQLERLAANPALRRQLGDAGRLAAARRFDRTRLAGALIDVYRECLGSAPQTALQLH